MCLRWHHSAHKKPTFLVILLPHNLVGCCTGPKKPASKRGPGKLLVVQHHLELTLGMGL